MCCCPCAAACSSVCLPFDGLMGCCWLVSAGCCCQCFDCPMVCCTLILLLHLSRSLTPLHHSLPPSYYSLSLSLHHSFAPLLHRSCLLRAEKGRSCLIRGIKEITAATETKKAMEYRESATASCRYAPACSAFTYPVACLPETVNTCQCAAIGKATSNLTTSLTLCCTQPHCLLPQSRPL